jgi:hypothetical protein
VKVQWGSEYWTSLDFEWSIFAGTGHLNAGPIKNGTTIKPKQPLDHLNIGLEIEWSDGYFVFAIPNPDR